MVLLFLILLLCVVVYCFFKEKKRKKEYLESAYFSETQYPYEEVKKDKGKRGEYLTSKMIEQINSNKRILFNLFLPKEKVGETSEIDITLITTKGVYVFENKNYSGWIYGNENDLNWCETFNKNAKHKFYNPIKQNRNHIKYLKKVLDEQYNKPLNYISVIVFNDKANLKEVTIHSENVIVCNTSQLIDNLKKKAVQLPQILEPENIAELYSILKAYHTPDKLGEHIQQIKFK